MTLKWTDTQAIAEGLTDAPPDVDARQVRFTDLMNWVMASSIAPAAALPKVWVTMGVSAFTARSA